MAEGKGFRVIAKINLPPEEIYHSGHSLIVQGDTPGEVQDTIADLIALNGATDDNVQDQAHFILMRFVEFAQGGAVQAALGGTPSGADAPSESGGGVAPVTGGSVAPSDSTSAPDLASAAVMKAVAKKTGKTVEELGELSTVEAQKLLKKEVKK